MPRAKALPLADNLQSCYPIAKRVAQWIAHTRKAEWLRDDMVAVALEAAWKAVTTYADDRGVTLKQYIEFRARGACLDLLRTMHWGPRHKWVETCEVPTDLPVESEPQDATVIKREDFARLRKLVAGLPARERLLVVRYYFWQEPLQDIARDFNIVASRASSLRQQACRRLRRKMDREDDP